MTAFQAWLVALAYSASVFAFLAWVLADKGPKGFGK